MKQKKDRFLYQSFHIEAKPKKKEDKEKAPSVAGKPKKRKALKVDEFSEFNDMDISSDSGGDSTETSGDEE